MKAQLLAAAIATLLSMAEARAQSPVHTVDGDLLLAKPAALGTGMTEGVAVGYQRLVIPALGWGVRASWSTATEYAPVETVRHDDLRLRLCAVVQQQVGRGSLGLRLGMGATAVYESRTRAQGSRAGLTDTALDATSWSLLPGGELEMVVTLRVWESWGMTVNGGPTLHFIDGSPHLHGGWTSGLGVVWQH